MAYYVMCTKDDFIAFFKGLPYNIGSIYSNTFPYNCLYNRGNNIYSADCWNMIKAAIWGDLTLPQQTGEYWYNPGKYGLQDLNGYQIIQACSDVSSDFTNLTPGEYLSTPNYDHAGVYVGEVTDGTHYWNVVECTPIWANGIQFSWVDPDGTRRQVKGGAVSVYWAYHGKLPWVDYAATPDPPGPTPTPDPPDPPSPSPDIPARNIYSYVVDKNTRKVTIIRDDIAGSAVRDYHITSDVDTVLIDFEG